jgi:hypothetical protein
LTPLILGYIRWVSYALLILSAIPAGLAIFQLIKARRAPYYALRRAALKRGTRWGLGALIWIALAVALLIVPPQVVSVVSMLSPPPPPPMTPTAVPTATPTPRPTRTPTVTPTRRPTATPPFIPTSTPDVPVPESALSPLPSAVPAGESARIAIITLAADADALEQPVDPGTQFPPGDHRVYLFFTYEGMKDGTATTFAWYKNGDLLDSDTWAWGLVEGRKWGEAGQIFYYYNPPGGWEPGAYQVRVFIETRLQGVVEFVIGEE